MNGRHYCRSETLKTPFKGRATKIFYGCLDCLMGNSLAKIADNILIHNLLKRHYTLDISPHDIAAWYKKIEMIGIEIKSIDQDVDPGRLKLKTKFMNQHFINELDKIGLQLIHVTGTYEGKLNVLLEAKTTG
ncbi:MAG: hypothetical protein ACR2IS_16705 [Nitrososphaeraceae archaeon]